MRDDGLLLGSTGLGTLGSVFGAALCTILDTGGIKSTAYDVITNTRKVLYTTAAYENDGVFLQVVAFTGNVGVDFLAVGEADTRYFTHCRVRFLRGGGVHTHTYTATLGAGIKGRALTLILECHASFAY